LEILMTPSITSVEELVTVSQGVREALQNPDAGPGPSIDTMTLFLRDLSYRKAEDNMNEITDAIRNLGYTRGLRLVSWLIAHDDQYNKVQLVWRKVQNTLTEEREAAEALEQVSA
jgi:hypothetical protein